MKPVRGTLGLQTPLKAGIETMPGDVVHYDQKLMARVPHTFPKLVAAAAARAFISPSGYMRQALAEKLVRDGFALEPTPAPSGPSRAKAA